MSIFPCHHPTWRQGHPSLLAAGLMSEEDTGNSHLHAYFQGSSGFALYLSLLTCQVSLPLLLVTNLHK